MSQPPPPDRVSGWVKLVQSLTLGNVLIIALLTILAVPAYTIWKALNDQTLLDRLMSLYQEQPDQSGCLLRHVKVRGGPDQWGVSSGFAFQGADRWFVSVILTHAPTPEEVSSYCESLKLIADRMLDRGRGPDDRPGP